MKTYNVIVPFAGHMSIQIDAESEEDAIEKALVSEDLTIENVESWEPMAQFNRGNVCYCPQPWEAEAELAFDEDEDAA